MSLTLRFQPSKYRADKSLALGFPSGTGGALFLEVLRAMVVYTRLTYCVLYYIFLPDENLLVGVRKSVSQFVCLFVCLSKNYDRTVRKGVVVVVLVVVGGVLQCQLPHSCLVVQRDRVDQDCCLFLSLFQSCFKGVVVVVDVDVDVSVVVRWGQLWFESVVVVESLPESYGSSRKHAASDRRWNEFGAAPRSISVVVGGWTDLPVRVLFAPRLGSKWRLVQSYVDLTKVAAGTDGEDGFLQPPCKLHENTISSVNHGSIGTRNVCSQVCA